jgi:NAD-dependent deacetylase
MLDHLSVKPLQSATLDEEAAFLRAAIEDAGRIAIFTGAGLSTESGVPDFRSPGSPWMLNKPIPYDAFLADPAVRIEAWRRKFAMDDHFVGARPGRGHQAIARLVGRDKAPGVITQNIDNLHHLSGLDDDQVVELHGNGSYATCLACGQRHELRAVRARFEAMARAPACDACGGPVKSATISFGQAMPELAMQRALQWSLSCDLFLAIGSSLQVNPAARLPALAQQNAARLIIINAEATPLDGVAETRLRSDIGALLAVVTDA